MPETMSATEDRAAKLHDLSADLWQRPGPENASGVGSIVADLADYIGDTADRAGRLSPTAVDEIATAYLQGAADAIARRDSADEIKRARSLVRPILVNINR